MGDYNRISISGKIASGKTTVSDHLIRNGYTHVFSAKYLKKICASIATLNLLKKSKNGFSITDSISRKYQGDISFIAKDEKEALKIKDILDKLREKEFNHILDTSKKTDEIRRMLQVVANTLINQVRETIWIDSVIKDLNILESTGITKFVHDDLRYPFEYDCLSKAGFVLFRINISEDTQRKRVKKLYGNVEYSRLTHISETALDNYSFDYYLNSEQSLPTMLQQIDNIIKK